MKKRIALLLALAMCLSLCACGKSEPAKESTPTQTGTPTESESTQTEPESTQPETEPETETEEPTEPPQEPVMVSIGDKIENDAFTMTFDSIDIYDEYSFKTSDYSSTELGIESGYKFLMVRGHFENKSLSTIGDSSFAGKAVVNDSYTVTGYDVRLVFERDKSYEIDPYTDLDYCLSVNIPEKLAEQYEKAEFTLGFNDDMSVVEYEWDEDGNMVAHTDNLYTITTAGESEVTASVEEPADSKKTIALGDVIETDDFTFTLNNVELTYEVKPQNTSSYYTSYPAESGKVYIHVDGSYYNKGKTDVHIRDLFTPTADYDNGCTYSGFVVTDEGDNRFTSFSADVVCTPLATCHYHGLIECPKVVDGAEAPLVVYFQIGADTYQYTIR